MTLPAGGRYGIPPAPAGLDVVQDLLNTKSVGIESPTRDLLATLAFAQPWADVVAARLGLTATPLTSRELARLRDLRTALREAAHGRDGRSASPTAFGANVALRLDADGVVHGDGPRLADAILLEVYAAQARDDWTRLKLCAWPPCDLAFLDRTRNSGARYHSSRCANAVNLPNSRARRRT